MLRRTHIVLHHSLTKDGETVSWQAIRKYHTETQGWSDIGYHYGVELVNDEHEVLVGRPEHLAAAAVKENDMNRLGIHVCLVGNFDIAPPSEAMLQVAVGRILRPLMVRYGIAADGIVGHHLYAPYKSCPGTQFDIPLVRRLLA
jgi:hypothetical protein